MLILSFRGQLKGGHIITKNQQHTGYIALNCLADSSADHNLSSALLSFQRGFKFAKNSPLDTESHTDADCTIWTLIET